SHQKRQWRQSQKARAYERRSDGRGPRERFVFLQSMQPCSHQNRVFRSRLKLRCESEVEFVHQRPKRRRRDEGRRMKCIHIRFLLSRSSRVFSISATRRFSSGKASLYSRARTLFGNPSSAYFAIASSFSAHRIRPTGGFSSACVQCSRA